MVWDVEQSLEWLSVNIKLGYVPYDVLIYLCLTYILILLKAENWLYIAQSLIGVWI